MLEKRGDEGRDTEVLRKKSSKLRLQKITCN